MKRYYDVIVIGGGPAGSTAAKNVAANGVSVALFERDREIGIPVRCGEAVGEEGLKQYTEIDPSWIAARIHDIRFIAPNGLNVDFHSPSDGIVLHRRLFDHSLAIEASNKGAEIYTKAYVYNLKKTDNDTYEVYLKYIGRETKVEAGIVIASDGVESRVARFTGIKTNILPKDFESCAQMTVGNIELEPSRIEFYFSRRWAPGGYVWVFPKGNKTANIGLGVNGKYTGNTSAIDFLDLFIKEKYVTASSLTTVAGGVPVAKSLPKLYADNFIVVGDAARQVNPMTGGGILCAMAAGEIAGKVAAEAIKIGDRSAHKLKDYQTEWHQKVGKDNDRYYRLKEWIYKMTDNDLNELAAILQSIDQSDITLSRIFRLAVRKKPGLLVDVMKLFARW